MTILVGKEQSEAWAVNQVTNLMIKQNQTNPLVAIAQDLTLRLIESGLTTEQAMAIVNPTLRYLEGASVLLECSRVES